MTETANNNGTAGRGILRRDSVRVLGQPALVECSGIDAQHSGKAITVVPLLDGARIAGFEVRCGCGSSAIVECVYTTEASHA
jgi:hypothetical protein